VKNKKNDDGKLSKKGKLVAKKERLAVVVTNANGDTTHSIIPLSDSMLEIIKHRI